MTTGNILSVRALEVKRSNRRVGHNLSFDVDAGDRLAIISPGTPEGEVAMQQKLGPVSSKFYEQESEIYKALAHPTRLRVLDLLHDRERAISELRQALNISGPNLSQHLRILKVAGVLRTVRRERRVYCSCAFPEVTDLCRLARKLIRAQIHQQQRWAV